MKKQNSPAAIGALCALVAALLPLAWPLFFFFFSLPLLLAAFVLGIVALARGGTLGGIVLMIGVFLAAPFSFLAMTSGTIYRTESAAIHKRIEEKNRAAAIAAKHEPDRAEESSEPISSPEPETIESTPTLPMIISLRQSVSIGQTVLPIGTRIQFISRTGETVQVRYLDADYEIPISATDFK